MEVQILQWGWDYSKDEWEASLLAAGGDPFRLRYDKSNDAIFAEHGRGAWLLRMHGSDVYVHPHTGVEALAIIRGREIRFADDTAVVMDSGARFGFTLTEQIRFMKGADALITMRELFWARSGRRIRMTTMPAGAAFPMRVLLVLVGFHEMVVRDRAR